VGGRGLFRGMGGGGRRGPVLRLFNQTQAYGGIAGAARSGEGFCGNRHGVIRPLKGLTRGFDGLAAYFFGFTITVGSEY
jgi:hypothetical protein